jgi:TRAP-type C4-dicarboxylate transport system substrate-binding protein
MLLLGTAALLAALLAPPAARAQAPAAWTLGDVDSASHWGPKAGQALAEAVDKASGGKLKITVYPTESLFKGKDSLDAVSKNLVQIYRVAGFHVAGEAQILELMDLPLFVPWDYDFRVKLWDAVTPAYREYLQKKYGVYLAGILQAEPRMIYSKAAIKSLADLKGKKIRTAGPTETEFTRAIGMTPHFFNKGYEVTKYIFDVGSAGAGFFVMVNQKALDALPAESRKALMDALPGYVTALRKGTAEGSTNGRQWLVKEGMTAVPVPAEDREVMKKAAAEVVDRWQKRLDADGRKIYEQVKAMVEEHNAKNAKK